MLPACNVSSAKSHSRKAPQLLLSVQVDVRSAAVGGRRGDPRRQGARSGAGALRNLWQNMWRNNGEGGEGPAEGTPGYQVPPSPPYCCSAAPQLDISMCLAWHQAIMGCVSPVHMHMCGNTCQAKALLRHASDRLAMNAATCGGFGKHSRAENESADIATLMVAAFADCHVDHV